MGIWETTYYIISHLNHNKHNPLLMGLVIDELNYRISELSMETELLTGDQERELRSCMLKRHVLTKKVREALQ